MQPRTCISTQLFFLKTKWTPFFHHFIFLGLSSFFVPSFEFSHFGHIFLKVQCPKLYSTPFKAPTAPQQVYFTCFVMSDYIYVGIFMHLDRFLHDYELVSMVYL